MRKFTHYIKYFFLHTTFYTTWLSGNGFHFGILETFTELKNWWFLSVLLKISWKQPECIFDITTYFSRITIKWTKYEPMIMYFHFEFLKWEKDFFWWREKPRK